MTDKQPEALRLANEYYDDHWIVGTKLWCRETVEELRRLHEVNTELVEALKTCEWVDDGGYGHAEYDAVKVAAALAKAQGENND